MKKIVEKLDKVRYQKAYEVYSERFYVQKSKPFCSLIYNGDRNMEQYAQNIMCTDEEKVITYCKNIIKAVEKTHDVATQSKLKSHKIKNALQTKDKQTMWDALQEYIHKHPELFTTANGVQLRRVDEYFYKNVSEEDVARQLEIVRGLIYLNEAKHCAAKETIKACFKKLLKQSGVFSEYEIEVLLL